MTGGPSEGAQALQRWTADIGCHYRDDDGEWVRWEDVARALDAARAEGYDIGFNQTGEGWNAEYPFEDGGKPYGLPKQREAWQRTYEEQKAAALRARVGAQGGGGE